MNYRGIYGWYYRSSYDRTASWTGVGYLHEFLINNAGTGPAAKTARVEDMKPGDLIQLSFDGRSYGHSLIIVQTGTVPGIQNIKIATHTFDRDYYPLINYNWSKIRFIHIDEVKK